MQGLNKGKVETEFGSLPKPIMLRITAHIQRQGRVNFLYEIALVIFATVLSILIDVILVNSFM